MYVALEDEGHILDLKLLGELAIKNNQLNREELNEHIQNLQKIKDLEQGAQNNHDQICLIQEAISIAIINEPENEDHIRGIYEPRIVYLQEKLQNKVIQVLNFNFIPYHKVSICKFNFI